LLATCGLLLYLYLLYYRTAPHRSRARARSQRPQEAKEHERSSDHNDDAKLPDRNLRSNKEG